MTTRVFIPGDSSALSVGADAVATAIAAEARRREVDLTITRTGSRGLFWLEPLVEADGGDGRIGFGPIAAEDVPSLFEAGFPAAGPHPKALGRVGDIPFLARQQRLVFGRCGVTNPLSLDDYRAEGGLKGLERAIGLSPDAIVDDVVTSGLRGRGGAGFPPGSNGARSATPGPIRNMSSATPTKATAGRSRTGC